MIKKIYDDFLPAKEHNSYCDCGWNYMWEADLLHISLLNRLARSQDLCHPGYNGIIVHAGNSNHLLAPVGKYRNKDSIYIFLRTGFKLFFKFKNHLV